MLKYSRTCSTILYVFAPLYLYDPIIVSYQIQTCQWLLSFNQLRCTKYFNTANLRLLEHMLHLSFCSLIWVSLSPVISISTERSNRSQIQFISKIQHPLLEIIVPLSHPQYNCGLHSHHPCSRMQYDVQTKIHPDS
jgi:hypothetical protein